MCYTNISSCPTTPLGYVYQLYTCELKSIYHLHFKLAFVIMNGEKKEKEVRLLTLKSS